ncbi:MAG: AMP-binding protein, partial [Candidatus Omnitrophica bacterium]|nr:AMP-binding protein [Candidatus Omnitrophota bacterium]
FTSGSTGEPKGVMISHHGYRAYREWARSYFSVPKGPHALLITAELTFDITMGDLAFALAHDVQIHVSPDPRNIMWHAKLIRDRRIDMFYSVPSTIRRLYAWAKDRADVDLRRLRWVVSGGEAFSPDLIDLVRSLSPMAEFHNVYGPTEVTINCMATRVDHLRERIAASGNLVPIGLPFPHLKTLLYDATTGRPAETMGELLVAGAQCMDGYYGDPERTTAAFLEVDGVRYYRTGDLVRRDPDGYHVVLGRIDDLVKVKGYRINPLEIDHVLAGDARVKEVKTVVFREGESPQPVVSFVVPVPAQRGVGLSDLLIERCRARLPEYMVPQAIVELDQLPCGSSGKYDANHLKRIWLEQQVTHATVSPS